MKKRVIQITVLFALVISTISGFSVAAAPIAAAEFFNADGSAITVLTDETEISAKITFTPRVSCNANVVAATYEKDKMSGFNVVAEQSVVADEAVTITTAKFRVGTADEVKLFVWNGFDSVSPLTADTCSIKRSVYKPSVEKFTGKIGTSADAPYAVEPGDKLTLGDMFTLAENCEVNLSGLNVTATNVNENETASMTYKASGSTWSDGVVEFSGEGLLKLTIQDYEYCVPEDIYVFVGGNTVTFNVTPADAEITLGGVTKQATEGTATFNVLDGAYDVQVAATGYVWQEGTLEASEDATYAVTLEADAEKSYFTFDNDVEKWTTDTVNRPNNVLSFDNGALKYEMADNDPYISSPSMNLDLTGRPKAYLTYKNDKAQSGFQFRLIQSSHYIPNVNSLPLTESFTTIAFDISSITGTVKSLRIDPVSDARNQNNATFWVDKIEIPKVADLTLTPVSTVVFKVDAEDAEVTLGGITKQVTDGAVSFDIANGTYDLQIAATGYVWQEGSLTVSENVTYLVTLEEDSVNSYWTFDNDVEGWKSAKADDTLSHEDGALKFVMTSSDPIIESSTFELDLTDRTNIYLTYKMNTTKNDFVAYPTVSTGQYKFTPDPIPVTETYRTEILDPGSQFTGTLKKLRLDPITSAAGLTDATFWIDKIVIPRIADLSITAVSTVKFNVAAEDAKVTLNGVTKQVTDGAVCFDVEKGTYDDLQIAATGYIWQKGSLTVSGDAEYVVRLAKDTAKSYWTFDTDLESWTCNNAADTLSNENGALKLAMASNDPGISKNGVSLDMTGRDKLYLTYKKENAVESAMLIYFKSIIDGTTYNHSSARALTKTLPAETDGFVTEVFDKNEYFAGTLENLRIDPVSSATGLTGAAFYIDKIEIPKVAGLNLVSAVEVESLAENVSVSTVFSDHMVLQRGRPVCIWGTAEGSDGLQVEVSLGDNCVYAEVEDGEWQAYLPAMEANKTPQTLTVYGKNSYASFEDVCVGDVYFVGGQSNADYTFSRTDTYSADVAASANDSIRFFYQNRADLYSNNGKADSTVATTPQENPMARGNYRWEVAAPDTVGKISAIGYYFADTVAEAIENEIPIGLVQVASGGSLLNHSTPAEINQKYDALYNTTEFTTGDASYIYNAMIHPVEKYTARGMLWYQGESDSSSDMKSLTYAERFEELVSYLEGVNGSEWDVFYVQLSSHNGATNAAVAGWKVARMRAIQYNMQAEDRIMVVSMDNGVHKADEDEAHPAYKKPVGQRLGAVALAKIYGVGTLETAQSPMPESVEYTANGATITFKNVQDGLKAYNNENVLGFELTKDGVAVPAAAKIVGNNTVQLTTASIKEPDGVRYGYYMAASLNAANLVNSADLPCPTFALGEGTIEIAPFSVGILDVENDYRGESIVLPANFAEGAHIQAYENWGISSPYSLPESPNGAVNFKNMTGNPSKPLVYLNVYADKEYPAVDLSIKYTSYDGTYYAENGTGYVYSAPVIKVNEEPVNLNLTTTRGKLYGLWRTDKIATVSLQPGLNRIPVEWVSGWTYIDQFILGEAMVAYSYAGGVADISSDYADGAKLNTTQTWGSDVPESPNGAVDFMNMKGTPANPSVTLMVYADKAYENVPLSLKYTSYDGTSFVEQGYTYSAPQLNVNGETVSLTTTTGPGKGWGYWTTQQVATVNLQPGINEIPVEWVSGWTYIDRFILGAE